MQSSTAYGVVKTSTNVGQVAFNAAVRQDRFPKIDKATALQRYDTQLLTQAGIRIDGRMQVKFISKDLEDQLAVIELEHAKTNGRADVSKIVKTIFASTRRGERYEFQVIAQRYRK